MQIWHEKQALSIAEISEIGLLVVVCYSCKLRCLKLETMMMA